MLVNHDFRPDPSSAAVDELLDLRRINLLAMRSGLTVADLDMSGEAGSDEKVALRFRFFIIAVASVAPWLCALGIYNWLLG